MHYYIYYAFLPPDCKDSKGKEIPCELGSTQKMLSKEVNNFDVSYVQYT